MRQMKNREKSLSTILSNAFRLIQSGPNVAQTCTNWSDKDTFHFNFFPNAPIALYVDFLYFMHMPPHFTVVKYHELASHLWKLAVTKFLHK